jgi:hypothetical protein
MTDRRLIPHFSVTTVNGERCSYADLWQKKNLLLVVIPGSASSDRDAYISGLQVRVADLTAHETACVITSEDIPDVRSPAVVIADRWGEIAFVAEPRRLEDLPDIDAIIEWLRHVQARCPECEGEAR